MGSSIKPTGSRSRSIPRMTRLDNMHSLRWLHLGIQPGLMTIASDMTLQSGCLNEQKRWVDR